MRYIEAGDFDGNTATYTYLPPTDLHTGLLLKVQYVAAPASGKANQEPDQLPNKQVGPRQPKSHLAIVLKTLLT